MDKARYLLPRLIKHCLIMQKVLLRIGGTVYDEFLLSSVRKEDLIKPGLFLVSAGPTAGTRGRRCSIPTQKSVSKIKKARNNQ